MFTSSLGVRLLTVPYKGTAPTMNDLLSKQVHMLCDQTTNTTSRSITKKVRLSRDHLSGFPPCRISPPDGESGYKGFQVGIWHGMWVRGHA